MMGEGKDNLIGFPQEHWCRAKGPLPCPVEEVEEGAGRKAQTSPPLPHTPGCRPRRGRSRVTKSLRGELEGPPFKSCLCPELGEKSTGLPYGVVTD